MLTCEQSLEAFLSATDELINSKYILADNKVSGILKSIAQSRLLYELFEYVTDGFDYATTKSVCLVDNGKAFALPQKESDVLAFCFLLLMEIDSHKEDIINIATSYFPRPEGIQASYNAFCEQVLVPFKLLTEKTAARMILGDDNKDKEESSEEVEEKSIENKTIEEKPTGAIAEAISVVECVKKRTDEVDELAFILGKLSEAVSNKKMDDVTIAYVALKYVLKVIKKPKIDLKAIEKEISEAKI